MDWDTWVIAPRLTRLLYPWAELLDLPHSPENPQLYGRMAVFSGFVWRRQLSSITRPLKRHGGATAAALEDPSLARLFPPSPFLAAARDRLSGFCLPRVKLAATLSFTGTVVLWCLLEAGDFLFFFFSFFFPLSAMTDRGQLSRCPPPPWNACINLSGLEVQSPWRHLCVYRPQESYFVIKYIV